MTGNPEVIGENAIGRIAALNEALNAKFEPVMRVDERLTRALVSFQDSKQSPGFRWYRFKEAFSAALVDRLLDEYGLSQGCLLDPFAGSGTALFAAAKRGMDADGIELLPIGQQIISARHIAFERRNEVIATLSAWRGEMPWRSCKGKVPLREIRITAGAYPPETRAAIQHYMYALANESDHASCMLRFALFCILESISYTRKDGQYLRWDRRAGRSWGRHAFDKGRIAPFDDAIVGKFDEMLEDLAHNDASSIDGKVRIYRGSCLEVLPTMIETAGYDLIFTSPPYCNRYDYTRTYALELALLGINELEIARLRQDMLSCTVENRAKDLTKINLWWRGPVDLAVQHPLLSSIDGYLEDQRLNGNLNNSGIPRMARGYFSEMACVIAEFARVLKPGGRVFMVNDNVRYAGVPIPVDLILSDIACNLGLETEEIRVLPRPKGNSSQQMSRFARELANAANLTDSNQLATIAQWLRTL